MTDHRIPAHLFMQQAFNAAAAHRSEVQRLKDAGHKVTEHTSLDASVEISLVDFRLPDGTIVPIHADVARGHKTISYTLKGGEIVMAVRVHTERDCDERCRCCAICYQRSGLEICNRLCEHKVDEDE